MCINTCTGIRAITALFSSHVVECWVGLQIMMADVMSSKKWICWY
jgi:hypothetical protein